jgi:SAM-dependent methyltransferase
MPFITTDKTSQQIEQLVITKKIIMNINYSLELLKRDKNSRNHIINELILLKDKYNIIDCKILELGCGLGQNLEIFKEDNIVKGVEGLSDVVHAAKSLGLDVVQANLEDKLSFPDNSQDWIICLDVLEHLINPFNLMSEIKRILKKDGKAIINVPNHLNFTGRLRILMGSDLDVHNFSQTVMNGIILTYVFLLFQDIKKCLILLVLLLLMTVVLDSIQFHCLDI